MIEEDKDVVWLYDQLVEKMNIKISRAVELLLEANDLGKQARVNLRNYDDYVDLRDAVNNFIDLNPVYGWSSSGCSF
jgi:hypothetical protein